MKRLAIFDFDGTLVDSIKDVEICFNKVLAIHNFPTLTHDEFLGVVGGNIDEMVSLILKDNNTAENIELVKQTYEEIYSASPKDNTCPFDDIHDALKSLQDKGVLLAINSNRSNDSLQYYVDKFFSSIDFIAIEGHNPDYPSKPSPCGVERILVKSNINKEQTIYIGDSITDIRTAQNAEIDCILVSWGYGGKDAYASDYPLAMIDDISVLIEII